MHRGDQRWWLVNIRVFDFPSLLLLARLRVCCDRSNADFTGLFEILFAVFGEGIDGLEVLDLGGCHFDGCGGGGDRFAVLFYVDI